MNQKLTLSIEQDAIVRGKLFAKQHGCSLSSVVEDFLLLLEPDDSIQEEIPISSKLSSLVGIGAGRFSEEDYKQHRMKRNDV